MKSLIATLVLFCLLLVSVALNARHVGRVSADLTERIEALPDATSKDCPAAVRALNDYWLTRVEWLEFSAGYTVVDRVTEQAATLLACAECGDLYGYRTALALLLDAVEDLARTEKLTVGTVL